jgi:hypothetical protein
MSLQFGHRIQDSEELFMVIHTQRLGNPLENLGILSKSTKTKFVNDLPYK